MSLKPVLLFGSILLCSANLTACGSGGKSNQSNTPAPSPNSQVDNTPDPSPPVVRKSDSFDWHDCTLPSGIKQGAQCTLVEVPLNWEHPDKKKIDVAVVRYLANGTPKGDIWTLDGGPTYWGRSYANDWAQRFIKDRDIYIPILRGTGASSFLSCSVSMAVDPQRCFDDLYLQYGDDLNQFNMINATHDTGYLIDNMSATESDVVVYGTSYGGFRAQRYLQYYPEQSDAIVIDSAVHLDNQFQYQSVEGNEVGYLLLDYCAQDQFCNEQLNGDPRGYFEQTYQQLLADQCPAVGGGEEQINILQIKEFFYFLLGERRYSLLPAFIKLLNRCSETDQQLLLALKEESAGELLDENEYMGGAHPSLENYDWSNMPDINILMAFNISMVEAFRPFETREMFMARNEDLRFSAVSDESYDLAELWQIPKIHTSFEPAETDTPILILHTDMDEGVVLSHGERIAQDYNGENHHFVVVPRMSHGVGVFAHHTCPEQILVDFLRDHSKAPDTSCTANIPAIDFTLTSAWGRELSQDIFDVNNLWNF